MTHRMTNLSRIAVAAFALAGCGSDSMSTTPGADAPTSTGTTTHYVTSSLKVGSTATEASSYAFDLDNDPQHKKDNELGNLLAGLKQAGIVDVDTALDGALKRGDFIILHSLKGDLTTASSATWQVYLGDAQANPDLTSGNGSFKTSASGPKDAKLPGSVTGGLFSGGPAKVQLQLALVQGQTPISVTLVGARLEAQVSASGCMSGRLGGGITQTELNTVVIPSIADQLNKRVQADTGCPSNCTDPTDKSILDFLDKMPTDGMITTQEILSNPLVSGALKPDVDLLDASGNLGTDGVKESASIAVGFSCVKATFTE